MPNSKTIKKLNQTTDQTKILSHDVVDKYRDFAKNVLKIEFNDINLLITALTHRSYINEHKIAAKEHNERLEYLGDAVLELVSSDYLYRNYDLSEGVMTALRAALVRTESIGDAGVEMGYEPLVRMSRGEKSGSDRARAVILADCFEAVIGAVYLDQGYDAASKLIHRFILSKTDHILAEESWRDPKSRLQELAQHKFSQTPVYRTLKEVGPDHDKTFTIGVYVNNQSIGLGTGHSKQEAQSAAATNAIKKLKSTH